MAEQDPNSRNIGNGRYSGLIEPPDIVKREADSNHGSPSSSSNSFLRSPREESLELEEEKASSGSRRPASNSKGEKEKRKRSRVTPEQLAHLERYFAIDRSPTAARRREISKSLGMHERQTQI